MRKKPRTSICEIADAIKSDLSENSVKISQEKLEFVKKYLGTKRKFLNIKSSSRDKVLRKYKKLLNELPSKDLVTILTDLIKSDTFDFLNFAGKFISSSKKARENIGIFELNLFIENTTGWAECDSICQSLFEGNEVLKRFNEFEKIIFTFCSSNNVQLKRASLVLQVKPIREIKDERLKKLSFATIDLLKKEEPILLTKAVSWLLRSLTNHYKEEVAIYIQKNKQDLPAIAYRETRRKIISGKK